MAGRRVKGGVGQLDSLQSVSQTHRESEPSDPNRTWQRASGDRLSPSSLLNMLLQVTLPSQQTQTATLLFSTRSCPFVCLWIGRWPLYCTVSLAATLQFAYLLVLLCNCSKYWLWRRRQARLSCPASKGQWLSNVPIKKNNSALCGRARGATAGQRECDEEEKNKKTRDAPVTDWLYWAPKQKL